MLDSHSLKQVSSPNNEIHVDPLAAMSHIIDAAKNDNEQMKDEHLTSEGHIFALLDFHLFLRGDGDPPLQRKFKEFFEMSSVCCIVVIAPVFECPAALEKEFTVIDFPYPSKAELQSSLNKIKKEIPSNYPKAIKFADFHEEELIQAATGLTIVEAENAYALSLVKKKTFDIPTILKEKRQIIQKSGILEYKEPKFSFDDIGGLNTLKQWLQTRRLAFSEDAKNFGLLSPKGVLLMGIPGTGKSMTCDALASYWQMPLLRLDIGAIFGSRVGQSEGNMRRVIQIAEAISPCILWIDEIEKGIGGIQSSNQTDGGVTNRVFGTLLTWMQEKTSATFVACTANNVLSMPTEFMRAGRFDEIFFVDLPNKEQRVEVIERILIKKQRNPDNFDIKEIVQWSNNYSPAEIEKGINNGLFIAYSEDKRPLTTQDITDELQKFQPLYNSRQEEIDEMREWALGEDGVGGRAVLANSLSDPSKSFAIESTLRGLDLSENDL